jgi:hypothetical protein
MIGVCYGQTHRARFGAILEATSSTAWAPTDQLPFCGSCFSFYYLPCLLTTCTRRKDLGGGFGRFQGQGTSVSRGTDRVLKVLLGFNYFSFFCSDSLCILSRGFSFQTPYCITRSWGCLGLVGPNLLRSLSRVVNVKQLGSQAPGCTLVVRSGWLASLFPSSAVSNFSCLKKTSHNPQLLSTITMPETR